MALQYPLLFLYGEHGFHLGISVLTSSLTLNTYSLDKCSCSSFAFTLQMAEVLIGSLMIGNCSDRLCVCVSLMWEFYDPQDESKLLHADMVLIDEEGGSAHAQIYPPLAVVFKPMIKEGNFYQMLSCHSILLCKIDVIGAVTMISDVATIRTKMRQTQTAKRSVTIQNESCTPLEVVLWGEQATSFPADQISIAGQDSLQIIIFVGTLARSYAGTTSLTGGSSCKWYVNPQVPEATSLAASLQHKRSPIMSATGSTQRVPRISTAEHKKVSEIKRLHPFKHEVIPFMLIDYVFLYTLLVCLREQC
ncbi:hypothetical protein ZEAMMB73_Zm00001d032676 [Zea mays]|uniref:Replication protein A OB domain-containing protein n=1 Tax=Zea mays TaxID=4577 RepID=A0A1D6KST9_MAIZE|nr:hypothetical protein ZEAMMB73_Zm00001d032676 [Zea mays]